MTAPVTIHDLQHPTQPAVVRALTRPCGMCFVPAGEFCHAQQAGKRMVGLVHMERATRHFERREVKGERNEQDCLDAVQLVFGSETRVWREHPEQPDVMLRGVPYA